MSTPDTHGAHAPFEQEPEHFHGPKLVLIGVITLIIFALAVVWATRIMQSRTRDNEPTGKPTIPSQLGRPEIGIVDQVPFEQAHDARKLRESKLKQLNSYGYIDKARGTVHVPIERAYELVQKELK